MSRKHSLRILAGALLIGLLASLLVACGGGGGGGNKATATKPATKAATAQPTNAPATATSATLTATEVAQASATAPAPATARATEPSAATNTPSSAHQTTLDVVMNEFAIAPSIGTAPAGTVTFNVKNQGAITHDFYVIKTDLAPAGLPVDSATFQVRVSELNVVKFQPPIASGTSAQVTVDLAAGHYVLICNIASHYQAGSRIAFTVQ
jgi:uncharacterized cupredoxin-like copper-binding protein